jgi:hypothetical protein
LKDDAFSGFDQITVLGAAFLDCLLGLFPISDVLLDRNEMGIFAFVILDG